MLIRRYAAGDRDAVRNVHALAFRRPNDPEHTPPEVGVFDDLIDAGDAIPALSFVAVRNDEVVGHVVCSRATVGEREVVALGPIGVRPEHQRDGIGSALVHAVLAAADALEIPLVALLGSTVYYPRFGFVPATSLGIDPPDASWGDAFQVRTLAHYYPGLTGRFRYAPAFDRV